MLKVALFISGRITCYEENLIPILNKLNNNYEIHLFISINGVKDGYHLEAEEKLAKWLKKSYYEIYKIPENFIENKHPETLFQIVDGQKQPYTNLSCFYNDLQNFNLIDNYEKENNFKYDVLCKLRSDLIFKNINDIHFITEENKILHSCIPPGEIYIYGWKHIPMCISDAFAYGNKETMSVYTNTYNYILEQNKEREGNYRINYEPCVTENLINFCILDTQDAELINNKFRQNSNNIQIQYFSCPYNLDKRRRDRDLVKNTHNF
jgi:hypothetical protein